MITVDILTFFQQHPFYIVHSVRNMNLLKNILNDGVIKIGTDVKGKKDVIFAREAIYGNIYFEELKNLNVPMRITLLLSPLVLLDHDFEVDKGWGAAHLTKINNTTENIPIELTKIYEFIKNPDLNQNLMKLTEQFTIMRHQIVFNKQIDLKKHLLGVLCSCDEQQFVKIKKMLNKNKYDNQYVGTDFPIIFSGSLK